MNYTLPLISVIVPVYDVERYLCECIDSILTQSYRNLEVILVNDGSSDNSGNICDEYMKQDNRVKVIHKQNGGLSVARNAGIEIAKGELIHFIDSDDWIEADMLELLYNNLMEHNAEISCCGYYLSYINENINAFVCDELLVFNSEQGLENSLLRNVPWISSCSKLYKKEIFETIRFPLSKRSEDIFIIAEVMSNANVIVYDITPKYYYRQRKNSISKQDAYNKDIMDFIEAYEHNLIVIREKYPKLIPLCEYRIIDSKFYVLSYIMSFKKYKEIPEYQALLSDLRRNYDIYKSNVNFRSQDKIKLLAIKINTKLYKLLMSINSRRHKHLRENGRILFD